MVRNSTRNRELNGLHSALSYLGVNPTTPPNFYSIDRDPNNNDWQNFTLCDLWLNTLNFNVWVLVSLENNQAKWVLFTGGFGTLLMLTSNTGGPVPPLAGNINVIGDGIGITGVGNPATNTITFSLVGATGPAVSTLTGNTGGAVGPLTGNINVVGDGVGITIVGVPGTHTLTASIVGGGTFGAVTGLKADDTNTAFPLAGIINIHSASANLTTTAATANTVTLTLSGSVASSFPTDIGTAIPSAGALTIHGGTNITTSALGSTVTVATTGAVANSFVGDSGTATPSAGVLNVKATSTAGSSVSFTGAGSTLTLNVTDSGSNTLIGLGAGRTGNTGVGNTSLGPITLAALTSGIRNVCVGYESGNLITSGTTNTAIGYGTLDFITTGSNNICIGSEAGSGLTGNDSGNVLIASAGTAGTNNTIQIGGTNNIKISLGTSSTTNCLIQGIFGVTVGGGTGTAVFIDTNGNLGTTVSSLRFKENVSCMSNKSDDIYKLRPVTFNYKNDYDKTESFGLIAEEVQKVMPNLVINDDNQPFSVKYHDLIPMLLNEIQKLNKRIQNLENLNVNSSL